ncbi:hypothetical protein BAUCODRAFT_149410 [Baudoinia panamericana UAMH 10762]|uniref:Uncharacterized protein n=1 Tax=Baudoinia panamericana (strain UAMH 10762) TaxID=717646 RepID=M2MV28_BAUPA|nr:uncharacterized protein BAUCODRAFT_149410 [Baudoinia panamericana UAMH 10762]EMC95438.1 hypothetical protein BAUCODRAFT_149410 [Baudoinia panamericana UAMH 10762]
MTRHLDDRYLWLGFSLFFLTAAYGIHYAFTDILHLTQIDPPSTSPERSPDEILEDSIDLSTLQTLATSPHHNIAESAISIIVARFVRSEDARNELRTDLKSKDPETVRRARIATRFLSEHPVSAYADAGSAFARLMEGVRRRGGWWTDGLEEEGAAETRWRRREVMVLHEGGGEVGEDAIIRPV